ncbi:MAG: ABC transporter ATP-binding protein [Candidatus Omnitrophica bacterium]|nr:ABC transporter ATP-binding protein [Candidatus Omnitrophota bacterium]
MLRIRNLTCGYDSKVILHDINLDVGNGELVGIIGPNGSGKTTLIRTVSRVLKPQNGGAILDGKDIWQTGFRELAQKIAVVPQTFSGGAMSVEEFVLLGRIPHFKEFQFLETHEDLEIAKRSMVLTDTYGLRDRLMKETSGGERQLALISRALAQEPKLLLLDEPTAHLDIAHQVRILDLIRRLNKELGLTVIIVLHDLNLASEYCRRLVLINEGRVHKVGLPEEVIRYQIIEEVYKTVVVVKENPVSFKPCVFLVSEEDKLKRSSKFTV